MSPGMTSMPLTCMRLYKLLSYEGITGLSGWSSWAKMGMFQLHQPLDKVRVSSSKTTSLIGSFYELSPTWGSCTSNQHPRRLRSQLQNDLIATLLETQTRVHRYLCKNSLTPYKALKTAITMQTTESNLKDLLSNGGTVSTDSRNCIYIFLHSPMFTLHSICVSVMHIWGLLPWMQGNVTLCPS